MDIPTAWYDRFLFVISNGRIKSLDAISGDYKCQIEFY